MNPVSILFIITIIVIIVIVWQVFPKSNTQVSTNNLIALDEETEVALPIVLEGKIITKDFYNKAGRKIAGVTDYFFETADKKLFIKIRATGITKDAMLQNIDKTIKIKAIKENG